jgi:hypothetical protein
VGPPDGRARRSRPDRSPLSLVEEHSIR